MSSRRKEKPLTLALLGTSLTSMSLAPDWDLRLGFAMRGQPECKGEVIIYSLGQGGSTSTQGVARAPVAARLRPSHVLMEGFGINDSALVNNISLETQASNLQTIVSILLAENPDVIIKHQTMSPKSASDSQRPNLEQYYENEKTVMSAMGITTIDNYASWPKPLEPSMTFNNDGLHPNWDSFKLYSFPNILAWAKTAMAEYWPT